MENTVTSDTQALWLYYLLSLLLPDHKLPNEANKGFKIYSAGLCFLIVYPHNRVLCSYQKNNEDNLYKLIWYDFQYTVKWKKWSTIKYLLYDILHVNSKGV